MKIALPLQVITAAALLTACGPPELIAVPDNPYSNDVSDVVQRGSLTLVASPNSWYERALSQVSTPVEAMIVNRSKGTVPVKLEDLELVDEKQGRVYRALPAQTVAAGCSAARRRHPRATWNQCRSNRRHPRRKSLLPNRPPSRRVAACRSRRPAEPLRPRPSHRPSIPASSWLPATGRRKRGGWKPRGGRRRAALRGPRFLRRAGILWQRVAAGSDMAGSVTGIAADGAGGAGERPIGAGAAGGGGMGVRPVLCRRPRRQRLLLSGLRPARVSTTLGPGESIRSRCVPPISSRTSGWGAWCSSSGPGTRGT